MLDNASSTRIDKDGIEHPVFEAFDDWTFEEELAGWDRLSNEAYWKFVESIEGNDATMVRGL